LPPYDLLLVLYTFFSQLDCNSGRACGKFIIASIDFPDIPIFELIKDLKKKKHCKVKNIGLMSTNWADTDLELAEDLGCEVFWKPLTTSKINSWIDACEEKEIRLSKDIVSECAALQH